MSARLAKKKLGKQSSKNALIVELKALNEQNLKLIDKVLDLEKDVLSLGDKENELRLTKKALKDAQLKYRNVTAKNGEFKESIQALKVSDERNKVLAEKLLEDLSEKSLAELDLQDAKNKISTFTKEVLELKMLLNEVQIDNQQLQSLVEDAKLQVIKTRNTLSFRLGYELIFGFKSWKAFFKLPKRLIELRQDARRRKVTNTKSVALIEKKLSSLKLNNERVTSTLSISKETTFAATLKGLRVASIMDEFTFNSYASECTLFGLTPQNWKKELEAFNPDVVFIESAWRGKLDLWGAKVGHMSQEVVDIALWCKENDVPSLFWNKEDPIHFETFLSTARLFDYIFTTDIDCVSRYKAALNHDNVYFLPFAAQPKVNNPIEKYVRKDAFCFAGAYYKKYPERTKDLGNFVLSLPEFKPLEIYDRNYGKNNPEYMFPEEYTPYIVGTLAFEEIDKAYKGYNYAINLNSVKQSQSMFARRVYELLASNTITVSNFSKGIKNLFGDLVFNSDSGTKIMDDLKRLTSSDIEMKRFRLKALRKVMSEHTYQDRLAYIYSKLSGESLGELLPKVAIYSYVKNQEQLDVVIGHVNRQDYKNIKLFIGCSPSVLDELNTYDEKVAFINLKADLVGSDQFSDYEWVAPIVHEDFYDKFYLTDLVLATRYSDALVIGKGSYYKNTINSENIVNKAGVYQYCSEIIGRTAIVKTEEFIKTPLLEFTNNIYTYRYDNSCFSIDEFSYCMNATKNSNELKDKTSVYEGIPIARLQQLAEDKKAPNGEKQSLAYIDAEGIGSLIAIPANTLVSMERNISGLEFSSKLPDGKHEYWYAKNVLTPEEFGVDNGTLHLYLETTPGLNLQFVLFFLNKAGERISHVVKAANRNNEIEVPNETATIKFGLRIYAAGSAVISKLFLERKPVAPVDIVQNSDVLLITNNYPSYQDLYKNGFVHSRVKGYESAGQSVDVWRYKPDQEVSFHEFEGVCATTGGGSYLEHTLTQNSYKHILIHFLDENIWEAVLPHIGQTKVTVWVHGADIQSYQRRAFLYETEEAMNKAKEISEKRQAFWRSVYEPVHKNLHTVFVSNYLAQSAMDDLHQQLSKEQYSIIPNPIDTDLFNFVEKTSEQRKKILSIRPYASKVYANDLAVKAVLELSKEDYFTELEFRFIGAGPLFEETLAPLRQFENVIIEEKFLSRYEIAELHKEYGVFLCPSRMDTQGVSRDEAMASGLVPVTNAVAAIPEFVGDDCGVLAKGEDYKKLAMGISYLYQNPEAFNSMSQRASENIKIDRSQVQVLERELNRFSI